MFDAPQNAKSIDAAQNANKEWLLVAQGASGSFRKVEVSSKTDTLLITWRDGREEKLSFGRKIKMWKHLCTLAEKPDKLIENSVLTTLHGYSTTVDAPLHMRNRAAEFLAESTKTDVGYWKMRLVTSDEGQTLKIDGTQEPEVLTVQRGGGLSEESPDQSAREGFTIALLHDALVGGSRFAAWARLGSWDPLVPFPDDEALDESSFLRRLLSADCVAELGGHDGFSLDALVAGSCSRDALNTCYNALAGDYFLSCALGSVRRFVRELGLSDGALQGLAGAVFDAAGAPQLAEPFFRCSLQDPGKGLLFLVFFAMFGADGTMRFADLLAPMR